MINLVTPILVLCATIAHAAENATTTTTTTTTEKPGGVKGFFKDIGKGITKEVADVKQVPTEALVYIGSSQCSGVKRLVGVAYEQVEGEKEPDLGQLTLNFITKDVSVSYNLSRAAKLVPRSQILDPKQKLYIYLHGFTDDPTGDSFSNIREALFSQDKCNVLALDGSSLIKWLYLRSTTYIRFMGEKLGEVLAAMTKSGVDPAQIHVIGHSLGSHIASFTGKQFANLTGQKVARISGLDPAGPCFSHVDDDLRLKKTDANFVDVIHTDAGVLGLKDAVGHVDYYPNAGSQQPNCLWQTCSHSRAWLYYAESVVNSEAFPAVECDDWDQFKAGNCSQQISYMGHPSKPGTTGTYYLQTRGESPFGLGLNGTKWKNTDGVIKNIANGVTSLFG